MKQIKYTPDAADKLRSIKKYINIQYAQDKSMQVISTITNAIRNISTNENRGIPVSEMFHIATKYRYIYVMSNYVFYSVETECIKIINIYNEKEDFMCQLFGIDTTQQETLDYWKE